MARVALFLRYGLSKILIKCSGCSARSFHSDQNRSQHCVNSGIPIQFTDSEFFIHQASKILSLHMYNLDKASRVHLCGFLELLLHAAPSSLIPCPQSSATSVSSISDLCFLYSGRPLLCLGSTSLCLSWENALGKEHQ